MTSRTLHFAVLAIHPAKSTDRRNSILASVERLHFTSPIFGVLGYMENLET